jgi:hypothetical protein
MQKPKDVQDIAASIRTAAATPVQAVPQLRTIQKTEKPVKAKSASIPVFVRVPVDLHAELEREATTRTKQTGKGVTVQQIILERTRRT